jgi:polygalacturonase
MGIFRLFVRAFTAGLLSIFALTVHAQTALPGYFNVQTYGAAGNGYTDDTDAIDSAIAAAAAFSLSDPKSDAHSAIVYFPTGQYEITSTITLPNRVALGTRSD